MSLASACAATSYAAAPAEVQTRLLDLVADTLAVTALGSGRAELRALVEESAVGVPEGQATVVGSTRGWPSGTAAFLNATAVAADQLQDGHRLARGHPASHVVPAVLALAEERDLGGDELLSAVLAGYEVGTRIGQAMGGTRSGVHDIGTWGAVAVAAAVARLLRPSDVAASERAIGLAASAVQLSDAQTIFSGRTGGHAFLGTSVELGTSLGRAAVAGLEPLDGSLERHLAAVAAHSWSSAPVEVGDSWDHYEILQGYVKVHPTCAHLHGVNDAVADLLAAAREAGSRLRPEDVAEVQVRTFAAAAAFDSVADGELDARFSIPTSVAVALVHGVLDEATLTADHVRSPAVLDLASRVRVVHDPALDAAYPDGRPAHVEVHRHDGPRLTAYADRPRGDADRALPHAQMRAKAFRLLIRSLGEATDVLAAVDALGRGGTARDLGTALRAAAESSIGVAPGGRS